MKKVIAFFFAIVYLVFTSFAVMQQADGSEMYGNQATVIFDQADAKAKSSTQSEDKTFFAGPAFSKTSSHLAATGKIKAPRIGFVHISSRTTQPLANITRQLLETGTAIPANSSTPLFLRNSVLRI